MSGLGFTIVQDGALGKPHVTVMVDGTQAQFKPLRPSKTLDIQYNVVGVRVCMRALSRSELTTPCFCRACCRIQLESGQDATSLTSLRSKRSGKGSRADLYVVCLLRSARGQGSLLTFLVCLVSVGAIESIEPLENPKNLVPRGIQLAGRRSRPRRPSRKLSRSCPLWRQALALVLWLPPLPTRRARRCLRTQPPLWHSTVRRAQPQYRPRCHEGTCVTSHRGKQHHQGSRPGGRHEHAHLWRRHLQQALLITIQDDGATAALRWEVPISGVAPPTGLAVGEPAATRSQLALPRQPLELV